MISGLSGIELLPPYGESPDLTDRLSRLFDTANTFRASIAFWTFSPADLSELLGIRPIQVLRKQDSYLCVDLHFPTNIDSVAELASEGVRIYLNLRRLPKGETFPSLSPGLLHTKMVLVDGQDEFAEFWIGSHNWTRYALTGPNTEATLAVHLYKRSPLYLNAEAVLNEIRSDYCQPFKPDLIDFYKLLQKKSEYGQYGHSITELEGQDVHSLGGQTITIFGTEENDFKAISRIDNTIYLSIYDTDHPQDRYLYKAAVRLAGRLPTNGISLVGPRRFAFTQRKAFPLLLPAQVVGGEVLNAAYFFADLQVTAFVTKDYSLANPLPKNTPLWQEAKNDPVLSKMEKAEARKKMKHIPKILIPDEKIAYAILERKSDFLPDEDRPLLEKKMSNNYEMISKKVILRKKS